MESALLSASGLAEDMLNAIAIVLVLIGAVHALAELARLIWGTRLPGSRFAHLDKRDIYIHFAQWLVAALTFQLAADIVSTTVAPAWEDIGRVAAIAVIRTFLTYFLDRDLETARRIRREEGGTGSDAGPRRAKAGPGD